MSLEKNGHVSSLKCTKHIEAKYFLVKDYHDARSFLQNCPRDYDDDVELKLLMKPQDFSSSRECIDGYAKMRAKSRAKSQAKSPTCVSQVTWGPVTPIPHKNRADNMDRTKSYNRPESPERAQIIQRIVPKDRA